MLNTGLLGSPFGIAAVAASCVLALMLMPRLLRGVHTLRGLALMPGVSQRLAPMLHSNPRAGDRFFAADGAPEQWVARRRAALDKLAREFEASSPLSAWWADTIRDHVSDLRFADANRVPFPFADTMRESSNVAGVAVRSEGPYLIDLDGNRHLHVSGSYGVNVAGYERYKTWTAEGWQTTRELGPVLGPMHPVVADNVTRLRSISGQDEVSLHVSGTEAVMAAVHLARFNTRRGKIVYFSGAYHGWWDGVQPGLGSERPIGDCTTLTEMKPGSLAVIRKRRNEIAAVLINPVQSFHPNSPPPNDAVLLNSEVRQAADDRTRYAQWLSSLRAVCDECGVPLIFDEVFSGFRLAPGGAQDYFGVRADMVVYGKTVAGGEPIGVVCGPRRLLQRFDAEHPMRIAYVVGTFAAHPLAMGTMNAFLTWVMRPETAREYEAANTRADQWAHATNRLLTEAGAPINVVNMGTIWTVRFDEPSRYNWLLQYYLRREGVNLSWVGTGHCLFSMDFSDADHQFLTTALVRAATAMRQDGWWLTEAEHPDRNRAIVKGLRSDLVRSMLPPVSGRLRAFAGEVMRRKHDDHEASHSPRTNQFLHLVSSSVFILVLRTRLQGPGNRDVAGAGRAAAAPDRTRPDRTALSRQRAAAARIRHPQQDGHHRHLSADCAGQPEPAGRLAPVDACSRLRVGGRAVVLVHGAGDRRPRAPADPPHGLYNALVWFVKLVTDPFTDVVAYYPSALGQPRA